MFIYFINKFFKVACPQYCKYYSCLQLIVIKAFMTKPKEQSFLTWAYDHTQESHPKYTTFSHALYITITNTLIFLVALLSIRYYFFELDAHLLRSQASYVAIFLVLYLLFMMTTRVFQNGPISIYQFLWACNQCMLLAAFGLYTNDSVLIRAALVAVSVDQILWYIDVLSFITTRKFIIGVAKYIIWPQTSKLRLLTTFHHLWFLPLCLWEIHPSSLYSTFDFQVYLLSFIISFTLTLIGRKSTPKYIKIAATSKKQQLRVYMNLNLSWELWKDIKSSFLTNLYKTFPPSLLILGISSVWNLGNLIGFVLFWAIENLTK